MSHDLGKIADVLLKTGAILMGAGANTGRIRVTVNRIAYSLGYQVELLITHRALMLSVIDNDGVFFSSKLKRTPPHGVNFRILSGISRMSWRVQEEDWKIDQIYRELDRLSALPRYPRWQVLMVVALAGASFCRLSGGGWIGMLIAFLATSAGLFIREEFAKKNFNPYICVLGSATIASLISGLAVYLSIGEHPDLAFATSVLFLVPGVPLINSFTDLIDGNILTGMVRGVHGLIIAFCIALGLMAAMVIYRM